MNYAGTPAGFMDHLFSTFCDKFREGDKEGAKAREDAKASLTSPPTWEFLAYLAVAGGGCLGPWVYHAQGLASGGALLSQNLALALAVSRQSVWGLCECAVVCRVACVLDGAAWRRVLVPAVVCMEQVLSPAAWSRFPCSPPPSPRHRTQVLAGVGPVLAAVFVSSVVRSGTGGSGKQSLLSTAVQLFFGNVVCTVPIALGAYMTLAA